MVRVGAVLALIAALVVAVVALRPRAPEVLATVACDFAVMVDGVLRCDDEAPREVAMLCGREPPGELDHNRLGHGDAVVREQLCGVATPRPGGPGWGRMRGEDLEALAVPVDLNHASIAELESLPGIGPELARRIVEGRPYASVDALLQVRGIGPVRLTAVRPRARVGGASADR